MIEIQIEDSASIPQIETNDQGSKVSTNFTLDTVSPTQAYPFESTDLFSLI
jgi:hypothetical protein